MKLSHGLPCVSSKKKTERMESLDFILLANSVNDVMEIFEGVKTLLFNKIGTLEPNRGSLYDHHGGLNTK